MDRQNMLLSNLCKCGCGNKLEQKSDKRYYKSVYINGHYWRGKKQPKNMIDKRIKKGKDHYNYKDGRCSKKYSCIDCHKKISYGSKRCPGCEDLTRKGKSFCLNNEFKKGEHPWNYGLTKTTDKRIEKQSEKVKGENNPTFRNPKHNKSFKAGKYNNVYFRSSWEIAYAKYLDNKNIKWLYESKTFKLRNNFYRPDFYLPETDEYIEIKGYWLGDGMKKFKLFKKLYPYIKIVLLRKKELKSIGVLK
jgi:hypothetical protein